MPNKYGRALLLGAATIGIALAWPATARAIPIFAQRYRLQCEACHTVLPELNAFGSYFRQHGYRLPARRHGTTVAALRYQLEWEKDPVNGRRFTQGGAILANEDFGHVSAFVHYNLGAQGGPSGLFLGYLATYDQHTRSLFRAGLFELPLIQSPGQRLDDLQQYGYYGVHVGLNDLALASPRWGLALERSVGTVRIDAVVDDGEFKGAAYGGPPSPTGETSSAARPELALFARAHLSTTLLAGGEGIEGSRRIVLTGKKGFADAYTRAGLFFDYAPGKLRLTGEQWWGHDQNADGFGSAVASSGGFLRAKFYVNPHAYLAVRYDASANPFVSREVTYYGAFMLTRHARFLVQDVRTVGGGTSLGSAITVGFPWPSNL